LNNFSKYVIFHDASKVGLPYAFCKNTGHFDLSTALDVSCAVFCKRFRESRGQSDC